MFPELFPGARLPRAGRSRFHNRLAALLSIGALLLALTPNFAFADQLQLSVKQTSFSPASGWSVDVNGGGNGNTFVNLTTDPNNNLTYTFEVDTSLASQGKAASYPVTVPLVLKRISADDITTDVQLALLGGGSSCADGTVAYGSAGAALNVTYNAVGASVAACVKVTTPLTGALHPGMNQVQLYSDSTGIAGVNNGPNAVIRLFPPSSVQPGALFWISDSSWVPQNEWAQTDAAGNPLGPSNFAIVANGTKVTSTNPGQFYSNLWLPNVTSNDLQLTIVQPSTFCLSTATNGVSTKVFVGSQNIAFADPTSQTEYKRNHDFTIDVGNVSGQDVYMIVHMNYCQTSTAGLNAWPQLNAYTFLANITNWTSSSASTTINGILKK